MNSSRIKPCFPCKINQLNCNLAHPCINCINRHIEFNCNYEYQKELFLDSNYNDNRSLTIFDTTTLNLEPQTPSFASENMGTEYKIFNQAIKDLTYNHSKNLNDQETFFLMATHPLAGHSEASLKMIMKAKYKAGFLKPYDYGRGYIRLNRHLNRCHLSTKNKIFEQLNAYGDTFNKMAKNLTDEDLVLVEGYFELLLMDYDRIFISIKVPSCLWRRIGEIYKVNKEFSDLVEIPFDHFKEGKICIYELMDEPSMVNYFEQYGEIGFVKEQRSVLTSCTIRKEEGKLVDTCFSFTISRDMHGMPLAIIGNFLPKL